MTTGGSREEPRIELYMYSLNQEFPVGRGHRAFLKHSRETKPNMANVLTDLASVESQIYRLPTEADDWSVEWISNEWIENHTQAAGMGRVALGDPLARAILRAEDFGAILFEPSSDRVFKLNHAGRELFEEIQAAYRSGSRALDAFASKRFDAEQVRHFVAYLEAAGLYLRE